MSAAVAYAAGDEMRRRRIGIVLSGAGFDVTVVAASIPELVETSLGESVDVIVLACDRAFLDHPAALRLLRSELPDAHVVVVCAADGRRAVRKALAAGSDGYVCEAELERALAPTIHAVCAGQVCIPSDMRAHFEKPAFSFREKQVLQLVARGCTNGEIAQTLFLAESTVKSHLSSSFRKLGVSSRKEAAQIVLDPDNGLNLEVFGGLPSSSGFDLAITST
jgi:DNA-binding NarL/FixJ family response regulator